MFLNANTHKRTNMITISTVCEVDIPTYNPHWARVGTTTQAFIPRGYLCPAMGRMWTANDKWIPSSRK